MPERRLSILISALDEEKLIRLTFDEIFDAAKSRLDLFEFILVDDGSTDNTGAIMDEISRLHPEYVSVVHHDTPMGLGNALGVGIEKARYENLILLAGDREIRVDGFEALVDSIGKADLILGYRQNQGEARLRHRLVIAYVFRLIIVCLLGYNIKDYHGVPIFPVKKLRELKLQLRGYTYQVETIVRLLREKTEYVEVPFAINEELPGSSRVLRFKTVRDFVCMFWNLWRT